MRTDVFGCTLHILLFRFEKESGKICAVFGSLKYPVAAIWEGPF